MRVTYCVVVDDDVRYNLSKFKEEIAILLSDPDGWVARGYEFDEVPSNGKAMIHLTSPATLNANACKNGNLSCAEMGGKHMYLNSMRWTSGAPESKLNLDDYRQYMVSHEMGHILGYDHVPCPGPGIPAPIMLQQTLGIGKCSPNKKLTEYDKKSSR